MCCSFVVVQPAPEPLTESAYDEDGIDRSLIRWMLELTPTERLRLADETITLLESVRRPTDGAR